MIRSSISSTWRPAKTMDGIVVRRRISRPRRFFYKPERKGREADFVQHRWIPVAILSVMAVCALQGCATIVRGSTQSVIVNTRPPGAACSFNRGGQTLATANPTPETVNIEKGRNDVVVMCSKQGYREASVPLQSSFESWTLGNILFGCLIGVAVDAGSGAMHDYPQSIKITLIPSEFNSVSARDTFFDEILSELESESVATLNRISATCQSPTSCDKSTKDAQKLKQSRVAEIEAERTRANVAKQ
jgi:hypothetical protein